MAIQTRKNKDGTTGYLAKVFRGRDPQGKRLEVFKTFDRLTDARKWERQQKRSLDTGDFVEPSQVRLGEYLTKWLDSRTRLRERTVHSYRRLVSCYVLRSDLAMIPLARLTRADLEGLYAAMLARLLSPRTVGYVHSVLHAALGKAERDRLIVRNPATGAELPQQQRQERVVPDLEQKHQLLATSERTGNRWNALWYLLANGGLRPSEALGLTWEDVGRDRVHIRRVLVMGLPGGGWKLTDPKTKGSRRTVTLGAPTMEALAWHRTRQEADKETAGSRYVDHGFVFAGETGEPMSLRNMTARQFVPLLKAAGLPRIPVYSLRHMHATHLLSAGVPVKVVSERLGHASPVMTLNIYAHVLAGQQEDAVAKLEAYEAANA